MSGDLPGLESATRPAITVHAPHIEHALRDFDEGTRRASMFVWIHYAVAIAIMVVAAVIGADEQTREQIGTGIAVAWVVMAMNQRSDAIERGRKLAQAVRR